MAGRYDQRTTTFSQQGRLYQVEYAIEATNSAGAALGVLGQNCVVLAGEKKTSSKLLDQSQQYEKIFEIDEHVAVAVAGVTADANTLIEDLRLRAQQYRYKYGEPIPVEQLVVQLCDVKQGYTQFGGLRPFGVSFLFAGYDEHYKFQLYHTDPAGNYSGWKAHHIGNLNSSTCTATLRADWNEDLKPQDAKELVAKVLIKTMDTATPDAEKLEFCIIERNSNGSVRFRRMEKTEVDKLMKEAKKKEDEKDAEKAGAA